MNSVCIILIKHVSILSKNVACFHFHLSVILNSQVLVNPHSIVENIFKNIIHHFDFLEELRETLRVAVGPHPGRLTSAGALNKKEYLKPVF